jgi:hypothetical protein
LTDKIGYIFYMVAELGTKAESKMLSSQIVVNQRICMISVFKYD